MDIKELETKINEAKANFLIKNQEVREKVVLSDDVKETQSLIDDLKNDKKAIEDMELKLTQLRSLEDFTNGVEVEETNTVDIVEDNETESDNENNEVSDETQDDNVVVNDEGEAHPVIEGEESNDVVTKEDVENKNNENTSETTDENKEGSDTKMNIEEKRSAVATTGVETASKTFKNSMRNLKINAALTSLIKPSKLKGEQRTLITTDELENIYGLLDSEFLETYATVTDLSTQFKQTAVDTYFGDLAIDNIKLDTLPEKPQGEDSVELKGFGIDKVRFELRTFAGFIKIPNEVGLSFPQIIEMVKKAIADLIVKTRNKLIVDELNKSIKTVDLTEHVDFMSKLIGLQGVGGQTRTLITDSVGISNILAHYSTKFGIPYASFNYEDGTTSNILGYKVVILEDGALGNVGDFMYGYPESYLEFLHLSRDSQYSKDAISVENPRNNSLELHIIEMIGVRTLPTAQNNIFFKGSINLTEDTTSPEETV